MKESFDEEAIEIKSWDGEICFVIYKKDGEVIRVEDGNDGHIVNLTEKE